MFIVLETRLTKDRALIPYHVHGPFHLYEEAQDAADTYKEAHPPYHFTVMEVGNENEDECSHNWEHDEASNEFVCTHCSERKGG